MVQSRLRRKFGHDLDAIRSLAKTTTSEPIISQLVDPGTEIFREGDRAVYAYIIERGEVEIFTTGSGSRTVLARRGPGHYICKPVSWNDIEARIAHGFK